MNVINGLRKPDINSVPLATGMAWHARGGYLFQEKSDGRHEFVEHSGAILNAERMVSGELVVNDLVSFQGQNMRWNSTQTRWGELLGLATGFQGNMRLCRVGDGGEFLQQILSEGGEGIVAKPLDTPFGTAWLKCKRCQAFHCVVSSLDCSRGSVELCDAATGAGRGKLALRGKFEQVRIGSVLKVEAFGLTAKGLLREARLDRDTDSSWLVSL